MEADKKAKKIENQPKSVIPSDPSFDEEAELEAMKEAEASEDMENKSTPAPKAEIQNQENVPPKAPNVDTVIGIITKQEYSPTFFHDQYKRAFIRLKIGDHFEVLSVGSESLKRHIVYECKKHLGRYIKKELVREAVNVIDAICHSGEEIKLNTRIARDENAIWYDLMDKDWTAVKITSEDWSITKDVPIVFSHYPQNMQQMFPVAGGEITQVLRFLNIKDRSQQILFLVTMISYFVPEINHPILYIHGPHGAAKSTLSKILRVLVDPSRLEVVSMPRVDELAQVLSQNYFLFFDNVSRIPDESSDLLCKAVTGTGFSRRKLYTDEESIFYYLHSCVGINGINIGSQKPDLLDRSILLELERVEEKDSKEEIEIYKELQAVRPLLLGAIFTAVSMAMKLKPDIKLEHKPRMADFATWGCAIAEAIGYTQNEFIEAYSKNISSQHVEALSGDVVVEGIIALMSNYTEHTWSATLLLREFREVINKEDFRLLPRGAQALSRKLNQITPNLKAIGYEIFRERGLGIGLNLVRIRKTIPTENTASTTPPTVPDTSSSLFGNAPDASGGILPSMNTEEEIEEDENGIVLGV